MAALKDLAVTCPECGETICVKVIATMRPVEVTARGFRWRDEVKVDLRPDFAPIHEHVLSH